MAAKSHNSSLLRTKFYRPPIPDEVYLHDTPAHGLFKKEQRAFSRGCIRMDRPAEMASWVLGGEEKRWGLSRIEEIVAGHQRQVVVLEQPVPVYILYRTAYVNPEDRMLYFYADTYGRDTLLAKALFAGKPKGRIEENDKQRVMPENGDSHFFRWPNFFSVV